MADRLSTGLDALDRKLGRDDGPGIPPGAMIAVEVPPGSQYEPIAWTLMKQQSTVYLVTLRTESAIRSDMQRISLPTEYRIHDVGFEAPIRNASGVIELVDWKANVVVDTMNPFESVDEPDRYVKFLNQLKNHLVETASVGVLLCTKTDPRPVGREHTLTIADMVWELKTTVHSDTVAHDLIIRKFRGNRLPDEKIKLRLGTEIEIDTSRDIA